MKDTVLRKMIYDKSADYSKEDKTDQVSSGGTGKFGKSSGKAGKYRKSGKPQKKVDNVT